jgi:hypothetical protein
MKTFDRKIRKIIAMAAKLRRKSNKIFRKPNFSVNKLKQLYWNDGTVLFSHNRESFRKEKTTEGSISLREFTRKGKKTYEQSNLLVQYIAN